jgi:Putative Flp pilus-assembly TadE/G-like
MVAICLVVFLATMALAIDGGQLFLRRRSMVNAADAAALAYAQSCARGQAGLAQGNANASAASNVSNAVLVAGYPVVTGSCGGGAGTVKVRYQSATTQLFAPAVGQPGTRSVGALAKAVWGTPLSAQNVVPLALDQTKVQGACGAGQPTQGTPCNFWYKDNTASSEWGFLNLCTADALAHGACNKLGWDVGPSPSGCSNTGSMSTDIITNGFPYQLPMHNPLPTYVCIENGFSNVDWTHIPVGSVVVTPVANRSQAVLVGGKPYKYAIVGFTALKVLFVGKGNAGISVCGNPPPSIPTPYSNAVCIRAQWIGPQEVVGEPCPTGGGCGQNFGVYAINLGE